MTRLLLPFVFLGTSLLVGFTVEAFIVPTPATTTMTTKQTSRPCLLQPRCNLSARNLINRSRTSPPLWQKQSKEEDEDELTEQQLEQEDRNNKKAASLLTGGAVELFETVVQQVTGKDGYHFGDITKQTLSDLTGQNVTAPDYNYQLGDISKNIASSVGQSLTGDADYQFGDITRQGLGKLERDLKDWEADSLSDLPMSIFQRTLGGLSPPQRREVMVAFIRLAAIGVLAWGVVANLCTAGVMSVAWMQTITKTSAAAAAAAAVVTTTKKAAVVATVGLPILPIWTRLDPLVWSAFLTQYLSLRLIVDPVLLVVKAAGTLALFLPYIHCIDKIEKRVVPIAWRRRAPWLSRILSLSIAFSINNLLISGLIGSIFVGTGGLAGRLLVAR